MTQAGKYSLSAEPTHSLWNSGLEPRLVIDSGDTVHLECLDASGGQVTPRSTLGDFLVIDRNRIHALTGPIAVNRAEPGDVLEINVLEVAHHGWAWTSVIAGLGFLDLRFPDPHLFHWKLQADRTDSLSPAVIPLRPFCGVMGVAPAGTGVARTRPPGPFGGNLDVRELTAGATLYLPVFHMGALFSAGDAHGAQGDGEVCINGMEMPANVTLRFQLHKQETLIGPVVVASGEPEASGAEWIVVESNPDVMLAARSATSRLIDLLTTRWGFSAMDAYLLCSVAMKLRLSQVVNRPMITVSAAMPQAILPSRRLFPV